MPTSPVPVPDVVTHLAAGARVDALGVADRSADLAVATMSLGWNHAGVWEDELYDSYGVTPDPARIDSYRLPWNAPEADDG